MMICLVALFAAVVPAAFAGTATANLNVSALVSANCTLSASPLAFGSYDAVFANATTDLDGAGSVSVNCTNGSTATITLGQGANADAGSVDAAPLRRIKSGSNYLSYVLFQDSARTTAWGNTAGTGVGHTGTGTINNISVYGRLAAGQNVPAGSYADTVIATVTF
jgi:spore coat protein U-like protein